MLLVFFATPFAHADPIVEEPLDRCEQTPRVVTTFPADGQQEVPIDVQPLVRLAWPCEPYLVDIVLTDITAATDPDVVITGSWQADDEQRVLPLILEERLGAQHTYVLQVVRPDTQETVSTIGFTTGEHPDERFPDTPTIQSLDLENGRSPGRLVAAGSVRTTQPDGFVTLSPVDPDSTSPEALLDVAAVPIEPLEDPIAVFDALHLYGTADVENCVVARHRSLSGRWSDPSDPFCAVSVPPPDSSRAYAGCSTVTPAVSPVWTGLLAGLFTLGLRRRG